MITALHAKKALEFLQEVQKGKAPGNKKIAVTP